MNKERILDLAIILELVADSRSKPKYGFNMSKFFSNSGWHPDRSGHDCGTVACIGGWAILAFRPTAEGMEYPEVIAGNLLDLDPLTARQLFFPVSDGYEATPARAARVLRYLAETGKVDWGI